ncbi:hypothetical protein MMC14_004860 [Varicellaria rhodocarpa]|nr:hypothetical protein [Varicellaria rhodocarpa]
MKITQHLKQLQLQLQRQLQQYNAHLKTNIASDHFLESELMMLAFATGIMDVITFPDYHVFASNQTGNTALLAVCALNIGGGLIDIRHVGVSLGVFLAGGLICGQLGDQFGRMRRSWLLATNLLQTALVFTAAALHTHTDHTRDGSKDLAIITLLAFASGAQVAFARTVHIPEITTAMVTSAYIDFVVDPDIFKVRNRPRNRRFLFIVCLVLGSFIGAVAYKFESPAFALYLSALGKSIVCIALWFNPGESREASDEGHAIT